MLLTIPGHATLRSFAQSIRSFARVQQLTLCARVRQFNPIELGFGWLKKFLRRHAQEQGGTNRAILRVIYVAIRVLPAEKMAGFFRKAGYDAPHPVDGDAEAVRVVAAAAAAATAAVILTCCQ